MKHLADLKKQCERRIKNHLAEFLLDPDNATCELGLQAPTEAYAMAHLDEVHAWSSSFSELEASRKSVRILWEERKWKRTGAQQLPTKATVTGLLGIAELAQLQKSMHVLLSYVDEVCELGGSAESPARELAVQFVCKFQKTLLELDPLDWQRAKDMSCYLIQEPSWDIYSRTIPVAGLDTKWLERHLPLVSALVDLVLTLKTCPHEALSFKKGPTNFNVRFLDGTLAPSLFGKVTPYQMALSATDIEQLLQCYTKPIKLLFVENKQSYLALPALRDTIAIWGEGNKVGALKDIKLPKAVSVYYWGDIDSFGFKILANLRTGKHMGNISSLMMDEATLVAHRDLVVFEPVSDFSETEARLFPNERACLSYIRSTGTKCLRLEQERIAWDYVLNALYAVFERA